MTDINSPFGFRYIGDVSGGSMTDALTTPRLSDPPTPQQFSKAIGCARMAPASSSRARLPARRKVAGIFQQVEYLNPSVGHVIWTPYWAGSGNTGNGNALIISQSVFLVCGSGHQHGVCAGRHRVKRPTSPPAPATRRPAFQRLAGSDHAGHDQHAAVQDLLSLVRNIAPPGAPGTDNSNPFNWVVVTFNNTSLKLAHRHRVRGD